MGPATPPARGLADAEAYVNIPDWWGFLLLAAAAWRTFQLIARDDILDRPRRWVLRLGDWRKEGDKIPEGYREKLGLFIECPYCAGFWIVVAWWAAWQIEDRWTLIVAVPFALSAALISLDKVAKSAD